MDWQWQELVQVQQIGVGDHWDVQDERKFVCGWCVEV